MQQDAAKVCRQKLIRMIGQDRYELWFHSEKSISLNGEKLIVGAENDFSVECLRKTFHKDISALAQQEIGPQAQVIYCVKPALKRLDVRGDNGKKQHSFTVKSADSQLNCRSSAIDPPTANLDGQENCYNQWQAANEQSIVHLPAKDNLPFTDQIAVPAGTEPGVAAANAAAASTKAAAGTEASTKAASGVEFDRTIVGESPEDDRRLIDRGNADRKPKRRWESLESFVIDNRNRVAATSATHIVQNIGEITPLFVSGPAGCGKSHLLEGVCQASRRRVRSGRVLYMTAPQYTTQFLEALHQRSMPMFRQRFQQLDVFLLDDIQFFDGKRATLVELVQMIDHLIRGSKQVVLSADRTLAELQFLGPELITRISSGLVCRLDYPSAEARGKIVRQLAKRRGLILDEQVIELIAERIAGDVRHVCGALNRLRAYQQATDQKINVENAREWLQDIFQTASKLPSLQEIEDAVCQLFGLDQVSLRSDQKMRTVSQPRMLAMWLSRKYTRAALSEIGDFFGGRSHSTVISAKKKVSKWVQDGQLVKTAAGEVAIDDAIRRIETKLHVG